MADVHIKKTINNTTATMGQASMSGISTVTIAAAASEEKSAADRIYRWHPERVELVGKKVLIEVQRPVAWSQFTSKDPELKVYDWKKIRNVFRVKGMLSDTSWNNVAQIMYFMVLMFEDGGAFEYKLQDDTFNVNVVDYQFYNEKREGLFSIHFTIDLLRVEVDGT